MINLTINLVEIFGKTEWEKHVGYHNGKLRKIIVAFGRLAQMINKREIKMIHCAYVRLIFEIRILP